MLTEASELWSMFGSYLIFYSSVVGNHSISLLFLRIKNIAPQMYLILSWLTEGVGLIGAQL